MFNINISYNSIKLRNRYTISLIHDRQYSSSVSDIFFSDGQIREIRQKIVPKMQSLPVNQLKTTDRLVFDGYNFKILVDKTENTARFIDGDKYSLLQFDSIEDLRWFVLANLILKTYYFYMKDEFHDVKVYSNDTFLNTLNPRRVQYLIYKNIYLDQPLSLLFNTLKHTKFSSLKQSDKPLIPKKTYPLMRKTSDWLSRSLGLIDGNQQYIASMHELTSDIINHYLTDNDDDPYLELLQTLGALTIKDYPSMGDTFVKRLDDGSLYQNSRNLWAFILLACYVVFIEDILQDDLIFEYFQQNRTYSIKQKHNLYKVKKSIWQEWESLPYRSAFDDKLIAKYNALKEDIFKETTDVVIPEYIIQMCAKCSVYWTMQLFMKKLKESNSNLDSIIRKSDSISKCMLFVLLQSLHSIGHYRLVDVTEGQYYNIFNYLLEEGYSYENENIALGIADEIKDMLKIEQVKLREQKRQAALEEAKKNLEKIELEKKRLHNLYISECDKLVVDVKINDSIDLCDWINKVFFNGEYSLDMLFEELEAPINSINTIDPIEIFGLYIYRLEDKKLSNPILNPSKEALMKENSKRRFDPLRHYSDIDISKQEHYRFKRMMQWNRFVHHLEKTRLKTTFRSATLTNIDDKWPVKKKKD